MLFKIGRALKNMWYFYPVSVEFTKRLVDELGLVMELVLFTLMMPAAFSSVLVSFRINVKANCCE